MNKQPEITDQTKANLLESFWSLYTEKRIEQITVKEITARAGYNRGTFYVYFNNVYQCLEHIANLALLRIDELPPMPGGTPPTLDLFESFINQYHEKYKYYDVLLGERGDPSFQRKLIESIKKTILNDIKFQSSSDRMEIDYSLEYILSGMVGIMRHYFHGHPERSRAEMMAIMYKIMNGDMLQRIRQHIG